MDRWLGGSGTAGDALFAGSHIGAFFIGGALRLPMTAVFALTMAGATLAGLFGAAAAPLAYLRYSPAFALAATITRFALRRVMCTPS